ncbi:thioredoxin-related transmembrane protein 4 isoform X2 [Hemicordylus capensis]|uniref:thioredoxin-related transmembrane protein 4 isoform X2 n=1 Tax=Hemicordylus capensis TaxID=884348 RepID=UPI0023022B8F|nr:thioredoxin-related transmembrane protein 4 isoform X2 [Hemicordylus capensis]
MAATGAALQSEAGRKPPGILRCSPVKGRRRMRAQLLMLWGAAAAWASLATVSASMEPHAAIQVQSLSGSNWSLLLQGQWMVEFYAPWCPACQQMESAWEAFAKDSKALEITVGKVDVTQEPGVSGRFFVTTLPTIYHAKDGVFRRYRGSRALEDLEGYILERKWEAVEPVAGWKSPSSVMMHGMAGLFHLSGWIRLLVLLADWISPPKSKAEESESMEQGGDTVEEQQEMLEDRAREPVPEKCVSDGEDEEDGGDESQDNSSDDSAVEGSATEEDSEQHASDQVKQSSVRQRKSQAADDGL